MTYYELASDLKRSLRPVYFLSGPEEFLRQEAEDAIRAAVFGGRKESAADIVIYGPKNDAELALTPPSRILDELRIPSLFSKRKLVSVRSADKLLSRHGELFADYMKSPVRSSTLVLHTTRLPQKAKLGALAKKAGCLVECKKLYETAFGSSNISATSSLGRWVNGRARGAGLILSPETVVALIQVVGPSLRELATELQKIAAAKLSGKEKGRRGTAVGPEEVVEIAARGRLFSPYHFADAVLDRDLRRSMEVLGSFFSGGGGVTGLVLGQRVEHSQGSIAAILFATLARSLLTLEKAQVMIESGTAAEAAAKELGFYPPRNAAFIRHATALPSQRVAQMQSSILEAEYGMKSGEIAPREAVERLAVALCSRK